MSGVRPVVRDVSSTDWDGEAVRTETPVSFGVHVEIGNDGEVGVDLFQLSVCNPAYLSKDADEAMWDWRDQMLVLATLSFDNVRLAVENQIRSHGPYNSWIEFAKKMAPYLQWEFEGEAGASLP